MSVSQVWTKALKALLVHFGTWVCDTKNKYDTKINFWSNWWAGHDHSFSASLLSLWGGGSNGFIVDLNVCISVCLFLCCISCSASHGFLYFYVEDFCPTLAVSVADFAQTL